MKYITYYKRLYDSSYSFVFRLKNNQPDTSATFYWGEFFFELYFLGNGKISSKHDLIYKDSGDLDKLNAEVIDLGEYEEIDITSQRDNVVDYISFYKFMNRIFSKMVRCNKINSLRDDN